MVLIYESHEFFKSMLGLKSLLFGLSTSFGFFHINLVLVFVAVLVFVEPDLDGYQVGIHAMDHVLVLTLHHVLVLVVRLDTVERVLGVGETSCLS